MPSLQSRLLSITLLLQCLLYESADLQAVDLGFLDVSQTQQQYEHAYNAMYSTMQESQELFNQMDAMNNDLNTIADTQRDVEIMIRRQNAAALQALSHKLDSIVSSEVERRDNVATFQALQNEAVVLKMTNEQKELVEEMLDPQTILAASEQLLQEWCTAQILAATNAAQENASTIVSAAQQEETIHVAQDAACLRPDEAASAVLQRLVTFSRDGIGMYDHASDGTIVHQYTSPTYEAPTKKSISLASPLLERLMPQDWEKYLLSRNWKDWSFSVHSSMAHALGWTRGTSVAPPETILNPSVLPGSCWPMAGTFGSVVIRLAHPVRINAISMEHAPLQLLAQAADENKVTYGSAPRKIKVYGLPACERGCDGLGFDPAKPSLIASFNYNVTAGGVQTFLVNQEDGSCAVEASTCAAPNPTDALAGTFAGVKFEILDNYGNDAYTCVYRVRVHGDI
ncbi:hypothetical protein MPSEU_000962100 [Mayamaea pseudoterrestris]|nr:hypothetical protein MPSEU_000962100 [Mayamaea pseudoterrestris]